MSAAKDLGFQEGGGDLASNLGLCRFPGESHPKRTGMPISGAGCSVAATRCYRLTDFRMRPSDEIEARLSRIIKRWDEKA